MKTFCFCLLFLISFTTINGLCSADKTGCCNDQEMFEQCNHVQNLINDYSYAIIDLNETYSLVDQIPDLRCYSSIVCCTGWASINNFCQNMLSYEKCNNATILLNDFIKV